MTEKIREYKLEHQSEFLNIATQRRPNLTKLEQAVGLGLDLFDALHQWKFVAEYYESVLSTNEINMLELKELMIKEWEKKTKEELKKESEHVQPKNTTSTP